MMIHDDQYDENNGTDSFGNESGINISNENAIASPRLLPFCQFSYCTDSPPSCSNLE